VPFLAFVVLLLGALAAGRCIGRPLEGPEDSAAFRAAMHLAAAIVLVHVVLAWLDLAGISWRPAVVAALVAATALLGRRYGRAGLATTPGRAATEAVAAGAAEVRGGGPLRLGWAALAGTAIVAFFAVLAVSERIAFPDFVYHWGVKGHRYFLGRGIDYAFLTADWNLVAHRDYPQLVPELFALQSLVAGRFSEPALLLWSAVFFAALLVASSEALAAWAVRQEAARMTFLLLALATGTFAVGHQMAGSVDWIVAFALVAAVPALVRPVGAAGELQLGILAALAAASKLEGLPLAALLIAAGAWRRLRPALLGRTPGDDGGRGEERPRGHDVRSLAGAAARLVLPWVLAVTPWVVQGFRHDLFRDPQSGVLEPERAPAIAAALWQAMLRSEWHFVPLVLLLLPLLFLQRDTRLIGMVVALQLTGYVFRYFTASFDYEFSILSSFPRLAFHLVPVVLVGLAAVGDRVARAD
jgi:hypothetical protein